MGGKASTSSLFGLWILLASKTKYTAILFPEPKVTSISIACAKAICSLSLELRAESMTTFSQSQQETQVQQPSRKRNYIKEIPHLLTKEYISLAFSEHQSTK